MKQTHLTSDDIMYVVQTHLTNDFNVSDVKCV